MRCIIFLAAACLAVTAVAADEKKVVCYFGSWAVYRPDAGKFAIENIDPSLCTHLIYTFVGISGNEVKVLDAWQDLATDWGKDGFRRFNDLRKLNPSTKTLVAIGGWNEGSERYSQMASSPSSRSQFVQSAVKFVKKHGFDGFDLDWEYPAQRGGSSADVQNFVALLKEMREAFDKENLLLTAAVGAAKSSASQSYNIAEISKYLHFINLMTYDLHGSWEQQTGINAPLYAAKSDVGFNRELTVDSAVQYWLSQGVDPKKLIVGVPAYGRTFTMANAGSCAVGVPTVGPGTAGPFTREPGFFGYNEICEMLKSNKWTMKFDEERVAPYACCDNQWVGYDNVESVRAKAQYIQKMGLGGAMVWSIETDDFRGLCGKKYPLITTLNEVLRDSSAVTGYPSKMPTETDYPTTEPTQQPTDYPTEHTVSEVPMPTTEEHTSNAVCTAAGNIPDPDTCKHFIQCAPRSDGSFQQLIVPCPPGLCYKPQTGICDWK